MELMAAGDNMVDGAAVPAAPIADPNPAPNAVPNPGKSSDPSPIPTIEPKPYNIGPNGPIPAEPFTYGVYAPYLLIW